MYPKGSLFVLEKIIWETNPNPGRIRIYTSGCPKNQNKCTKRTGSPPPLGSKNLVLKLRSVRSIVIPPAKTGRERTKRIAVKKTVHTKRGMCSHVIEGSRKLLMVHRKLIDLPILEAPATCKLKIAKSTLKPGCPIRLLIGG